MNNLHVPMHTCKPAGLVWSEWVRFISMDQVVRCSVVNVMLDGGLRRRPRTHGQRHHGRLQFVFRVFVNHLFSLHVSLHGCSRPIFSPAITRFVFSPRYYIRPKRLMLYYSKFISQNLMFY
jgi:hypothetical protein